MSESGHSAEHFGDYRDLWWNADFIALMAARLGLASRTRVLDVGCGIGHWTRTLAPHLASDAQIRGVDTDPQWLAQADTWTGPLRERGHTVEIGQGDAQALPFPADSFDFVTCQTVLVHVRAPLLALREMTRVLAPGGVLLCAEPDNFGSMWGRSTFSDATSLEAAVGAYALFLAIERGRRALCIGDYSLGGLLPGWFRQTGLSEIRTWLGDKTIPLHPPYDGAEQQVVVDSLKAGLSGTAEQKAETLRVYAAGGGDPARFDAYWDAMLADAARLGPAVEAGSVSMGGGSLMYLVAGVKP